MTDRAFEEDLVRAISLVRDFRLHGVAQKINPRAMRVAIKVLAHIDDHFALKQLSSKEDFDLEIYASKLAGQVIKREESKPKKE